MPLTLSGTTGVSGVDGTAGTPAVRGGDANTGFVFGTDIVQVIEGGAESARFDASGNLLVGVTSANANGGVLQLKSGITFPATQVTSTDVNTLDDYEEGTWTPSVGGTATYTTQVGRYVKVGSVVTASAYLVINSIGTGSQSVITGLPFLARNVAQLFQGGTSPYWASTTTSFVFLGVYAGSNSTGLTINGAGSATGSTGTQNALTNSTQFLFSITYITE